MSTFLIPKGICDRIESAICRFWWGGNIDKRKIHWKSKEYLFRSKANGGQGFRNMHSFNEALLAKQVWRLIKFPNSLLSKCLKAKYFPHCEVLKASRSHNPSYVWHSIFHAKWVIQKGGCWKIGNGSKVNIWNDNWILQQNGFKILTHNSNQENINQVKDLIGQETRSWQQSIMATLFYPNDSENINQIPLIQEDLEDSFMWMFTADGNYSVKSGYNFINEGHHNQLPGLSNITGNQKIWKTIWSLNTIPRHKDLLWRVLF
jgi:hypothetical protein